MPVYRSFDQQELDLQYNVRAGIPDHLDIFDRWSRTSAAFRCQYAANENVRYGSDEKQTLDFFPAKDKGRPVLIFIHGGYWQSLDKSDFSTVALPYLLANINVAIVNYRLAPSVRMGDIVQDNIQALAYLYRNARDLGFDRDSIYVSGSSAGGHLTAILAGTDWTSRDLPEDVVKGACALSGLYDLEPIRLCYLNEAVRLDEQEVADFSPKFHLPSPTLPFILSVGGDESDEFHRLQAEYQTRLNNHGLDVQIVRQRDGHHFDAVDRLGEVGGALSQAVIDMILRR
ncbi:alpha/beta hydrolase [Burkholderia sp. IDO3]|uniref:alpha/beta hydrolase n=1 Tax=Burkholderia sp. IDO3 TaxID=1705310 RepID=UPI000BBB5CE3|nr:alpha/beta hydrolase [Burkholderia sp. IDO3]AXK67866.1 alpha/beta hydrolase [Burkholderia sp. IDO3]PCD60799.1 esterase [Burkholderia sp. IDO3]